LNFDKGVIGVDITKVVLLDVDTGIITKCWMRLELELLIKANLKLSKLSKICSPKLFKPTDVCSWNLVSEDKDTEFELIATVC